jgi:hypothetical protein
MTLDVVDAAELAELLQFLTGWIATDPARLAPSLLAYVGHPAYGLPQLRNDLDRFTFLLGGNDGEPLFQPGPLPALRHCRPALLATAGNPKSGRPPDTNDEYERSPVTTTTTTRQHLKAGGPRTQYASGDREP